MLTRLKCFLLLSIVPYCCARIHTFETTNDTRRYIPLSTFGFYKGGILEVRLGNFTVSPENKRDFLGFSIVKALDGDIKPYLDSHTSSCLLQGALHTDYFSAAIYFAMDLNNLLLRATCGREWKQPGHIYRNSQQIQATNTNEKLPSDGVKVKKNVVYLQDFCIKLRIPISEEIRNGVSYYSTRFAISILSELEEGLYNLYFHSCPDYNGVKSYGFTIQMSEKNPGGYLSAGELPLPALYCAMAILFFLSGCFWMFLLHQTQHPVSKMHFIMAVLVFLKSFSLGFNGASFYFIKTLGVNLTFWAVLFYLAHSLEHVFFFITLVLIGSGWTFIKNMLTHREKCLLTAIISLQTLATVSGIILNESEEGSREINTWWNLYILADVLCCIGVMFPVCWSIRRIRVDGSSNDDKAVNSKKLKLFRHFFVMIVCYTYLTRIITYLVSVSVPFQHGWLNEMLSEVESFVFFILVGYKFRPGENLVISDTVYKENLSRVNLGWKPIQQSATTLTEVTEEESDILLLRK